MKFLCVPCDEPMKLVSTAPPDRGSLSVVYTCPGCSREIAMLTNPYETQVVQSLGVRIGPGDAGRGAGPSAGTTPVSASAAERAEAGGCPFTDVVQEMTGARASSEDDGLAWTPRARERLENIPEFVRPMAKVGIEKFAKERGRSEVDEGVLDEAKDFFGM